jgi:fumarylacetoacetate (FAA) hydrolase
VILATLKGGGPDGTLVVVSRDGERFALPERGPRTLQDALDRWEDCASALEATFRALDAPGLGLPTERAVFAAPLPRAYHWAEGSCYLAHMERIRGSRGEALPAEHTEQPKVYQSGSDQHLDPVSEFTALDAALDVDLEATIVVITGDIAIGTSAEDAIAGIRLVGLANDLTYRKLIVEERQLGTGIYHSKPGRAYAPFVVTPDTLATSWTGARLHAQVATEINGAVLGRPWADRDIAFDFSRVLAHLCRTRRLTPGAIVGTGTVSNRDAEIGIGCIAEQRAVELRDGGEARTAYLREGDRMVIEALDERGRSLFGRIEQTVRETAR